jgi:outer membrane protein TolC
MLRGLNRPVFPGAMIPLLAVAMAAAPAPCGPLDLPTAMALAAVRSDEVAILRAEVAGAEADRAIARAVGILPNSSATFVVGPSPEAHGTILESRNTNRTLGGLAPFERVDITLVQPLWTWGQVGAAKKASEAGVRAKELLVEDTVQQVVLRVMQSYWGISLAKRLLVIAADVKSALAQADKRIADELARQSGEATQEDKYRIAVFRAEVLQRTSEAEKGVHLARVALASMLGIDEPQLELKEEPLPDLQQQLSPSREQAILQAEQSRPDLKALDQALEALEALARASRAAVLPQVFAAGTFTFAYAPNRDPQFNPWIRDDFRQLSGGAVIGLRQNLAIPLLLAQARKAEAEVAGLRRKREGLARLVSVQTEQALADLRAASEKQAAAQSALSAGRSWFRSAGLNFGLGVTDARSLIDAYAGYVKTQADSAQATYELLLARGRLDQVTGKRLIAGESTCALR